MAILIGRWDCPFCGHKGNLGPEKQCAACRKPRGEDVKFYLPEDAEVVTDEAAIAKAKAGPDWTCDYCGSDNSGDQVKCRSCANPRTQTDGARATKSYDLDETPRTGADVAQKEVQSRQSSVKPAAEKKNMKGCAWGCLTTLGVLLTLFIIIGIFATRPFVVTVTGHEWSRNLHLANYRPIQESGWELPADGKLIKSYQDIHHYNDVLDHYETKTRTVQVQVGEERYVSGHKDLGNGHFDEEYDTRPIYKEKVETYRDPIYRKDPVYRTKYLYNIYRWVDAGDKKAEGTGLNAAWPVWTPPSKAWKIDAKDETYTLVGKDKKGEVYRIKTEYKDWLRIKEGVKQKIRRKGADFVLLGKKEK